MFADLTEFGVFHSRATLFDPFHKFHCPCLTHSLKAGTLKEKRFSQNQKKAHFSSLTKNIN